MSRSPFLVAVSGNPNGSHFLQGVHGCSTTDLAVPISMSRGSPVQRRLLEVYSTRHRALSSQGYGFISLEVTVAAPTVASSLMHAAV
jgi:predicted GNAT superfamily acetyltransferase